MKKSETSTAAPTPEQFEALDALVGEWTTFPDVAESLGVIVTRVHSMAEDGTLVAFRDPRDGVRRIPAAFLVDGRPLDSLRGTMSVLRDNRYTDLEAVTWLFTEDESLPGRPIDLLRSGRKTEIRRRAQTLDW
ncbi:Rv2175c family DNA-binding protein [Kocuria palustris]|uniref:Rv2175c family DNA-binding protein n=1 Tax=Kocuria palustris TaxID=71999 RepID=UPI00119F857C|nr:Rv2175c family DNA-binding protein [Kocuria palustris]